MEYLKSTVMVIEGDEEYRAMYRQVIAEELKAKYREAVSPPQAIAYMRKHALPNLIVINTHLPEMDGLTAVNLIRRTPYFSTIKIIVTSHSGDEALVTLFAEHSIEDYLLKPFDAETIKAKVERVLSMPVKNRV
jgi:two-component system chemotaxis response regulator CheY